MKAPVRPGAFTLVEIMIVVAIIALLAVIAMPSFLRARKRSQATDELNSLRLIDAAVSQYAIETSRPSGFPVLHSDWRKYLKKRTVLYRTGTDIFGNVFPTQYVDQLPDVPAPTKDSLSDVVDASFWSPFQ